MVDAIDLGLVEDLHQGIVEVARQIEIVAEGLLDNDARPALGTTVSVQAAVTDVGDDVLVGRRWRGQVEEPVGARAPRGVDLLDPFGELAERCAIREIALLVEDPLGEVVPQPSSTFARSWP